MKPTTLLGVMVLLLLAGCARPVEKINIDEVEPLEQPNLMPAQQHTPGSLWSESLTALVADRKARTVGDIVTVAIYEKASASKEASTETGRDSKISADIVALLGLEKKLPNAFNLGMDPAKLIQASASNSFSGSGKTSRAEDLVASLSTQIIKIYPNGNLRISGNKTITVNNEMQIVKLTGIVRETDISPNNVINSKNILNARIYYSGQGVLSDKQKPGWLLRSLDAVWPF
ncbi:MAG: flagellar basal body L-ring protein FlgH [Geopsychrobacter sp.]|nr:flagellar basal body L-ring protein FlgH [Geopsychrobacter sp.]